MLGVEIRLDWNFGEEQASTSERGGQWESQSRRISGSVPDFQTAPCWIAITPDGRYAYTVSTANAVISGYRVGFNGELSLLGNGVAAQTVAGPLDNAFSRNGRYMYVLTRSEIIGYQVHADGSLTPLNLTAAIPSGSRGLVAR